MKRNKFNRFQKNQTGKLFAALKVRTQESTKVIKYVNGKLITVEKKVCQGNPQGINAVKKQLASTLRSAFCIGFSREINVK